MSGDCLPYYQDDTYYDVLDLMRGVPIPDTRTSSYLLPNPSRRAIWESAR
jgi:hypothetical protein